MLFTYLLSLASDKSDFFHIFCTVFHHVFQLLNGATAKTSVKLFEV